MGCAGAQVRRCGRSRPPHPSKHRLEPCWRPQRWRWWRQQGLKHTHTVGLPWDLCHLTHTHTHFTYTFPTPILLLSNTSQSLLFFFSRSPSILLSCFIFYGPPVGSGACPGRRRLSHGAIKVEARIFIFTPITSSSSPSALSGEEGQTGGPGGPKE